MSKVYQLTTLPKKYKLNNTKNRFMNLRTIHNNFKSKLGNILGVETFVASDDDKFALEIKKTSEKRVNHLLFNQKKFYDTSYEYLKLKSEVNQEIVLFNHHGCYVALQGYLMGVAILYYISDIMIMDPVLCVLPISVLVLIVSFTSMCSTNSSFARLRRDMKAEYNFRQLLCTKRNNKNENKQILDE